MKTYLSFLQCPKCGEEMELKELDEPDSDEESWVWQCIDCGHKENAE